MNKKAIMWSVIIITFASVLCAAEDPVRIELRNAIIIMNVEKDYPKAIVAFEKIINDNATTNTSILAMAQSNIGLCLVRSGKREKGRVAYGKAITNYPNADVNIKANIAFINAYSYTAYADQERFCRAGLAMYTNANDNSLATLQNGIGMALYRLGDMENAIIELSKVTNYPNVTTPSLLFATQSTIGDAYNRQRKYAEANMVWMSAIQTYVFELGVDDEKGPIWQTYNKLNPKTVSDDIYKAFLQNTLKAVKVALTNEPNNKFISNIKGELKKMKQ